MKICITVGHSLLKNGLITSASGYVNEYQYNKGLAPYLQEILQKEGNSVDVVICPERTFTSSRQEYSYKVPKINSGGYDLLIELHLNAFNGDAFGSEVLYFSNNGKKYADRVAEKLGTIFKNRGAKKRSNLYILRDTQPTAILIEAFFCDNKSDATKAKNTGYEEIARLIAEGILNKTITVDKKERNEDGTIFYRVICGSYTQRKNAEDMIIKLKEKGFDSFIDIFKKDNTLFFRVITGSYTKKDNALSMMNKLETNNFSSFIDIFEN